MRWPMYWAQAEGDEDEHVRTEEHTGRQEHEPQGVCCRSRHSGRNGGSRRFAAALRAGNAGFFGKGNTFGRADNEIFTYVVPDPAKTQLVVAVVGAIEIAPIVELFESQNPNVQVITLDITGGNPKYRPYLEWVANGKSPHVMMLGNSTVPLRSTAPISRI